jgi:hypothetical protein
MKSMTPPTPTRARLLSRPPRPTADELERHPALAGDWMELTWNIDCLEALRELREERAWVRAVGKCRPGHA